jgi:hypothetical protein
MSYIGQDADDARRGMDNFVAHLNQQQAGQDAMLQGYRDRQHDTNKRVLESTALITAGVMAWNARHSNGTAAQVAPRAPGVIRRFINRVNENSGLVPSYYRTPALTQAQDISAKITNCLLGAKVGTGPSQGQMINKVTIDQASITGQSGITVAEADVVFTDGSSHRVMFNTNGNDWVWTEKAE